MAPRETQRNDTPLTPAQEGTRVVALQDQDALRATDPSFLLWMGEARPDPRLRVRVTITRTWIILSLVDRRSSSEHEPPRVSILTVRIPQEQDPMVTVASVRRAFDYLPNHNDHRGLQRGRARLATIPFRSQSQGLGLGGELHPRTVDSFDSFLCSIGVRPDTHAAYNEPVMPVIRSSRWPTSGLGHDDILIKITNMLPHSSSCSQKQDLAQYWIIPKPALKMTYIFVSCIGCSPIDRRLTVWGASRLRPHDQDDRSQPHDRQASTQPPAERPYLMMAHLATWDQGRHVWRTEGRVCTWCRQHTPTDTAPSQDSQQNLRHLLDLCLEVTFCLCQPPMGGDD